MPVTNRHRFLILSFLVIAACANPTREQPDAGRPVDANASRDAGAPDVEAPDAETEPDDSGTRDAAITDAGTSPGVDSGVPDSGCAVPARAGSLSGFTGPPPILYYTFDDDHREGANLLNTVGLDNDATANASVGIGIEGPVGQAVAFDGAEALVSSDPPKSNRFTATMWLRPRAWPTDERRVIFNVGNGPSAWQGWGVTLRTTGQVIGFVEGGGSIANEHVAPTIDCVPPGQWTHIAVTMDGTVLRLYENGVLQTETSVNLSTINFGTVGLVLGYHSFFQNAYYDGDVDELAAWDVALPEEDIAEVYFAGRDGLHFTCPSRCGAIPAPVASVPSNGLVGWFRADRGVGRGPGGDVCVWCDLSPQEHDLAQSVPANQPDGVVTGSAGLPAVSFSSTGQHVSLLGTLSMTSTAGRTFVAVYRPHTIDERTVIVRMGRRGTLGTYLMIEANTFNTRGQRFGTYVTNNAYDADTTTSTDSPSLHVMRLASMTVGAPVLDELAYWINGVSQTLLRTPGGLGNGNVEVFLADETSIGSFGGGALGGADISEVLVFDRPLDEGERTQLETYLTVRYGL